MFLMLFASLQTIAQTNNTGLARVNKINGTEAYFLAEPLRSYTVVFEEGTGVKMSSVVTAGLVNESAADKAEQFVKRVQKQAKKDKVEFDAVVYTGGKKVVAIKFNDEATAETKGIGRVQKIDGVEVYAFAEPLKAYKTVNKKGGGLKLKSMVTGGLVNNSIEEDLKQFLSRIADDCKDDKVQLDAIIYTSGKSAIGIQFTE